MVICPIQVGYLPRQTKHITEHGQQKDKQAKAGGAGTAIKTVTI
jgi:hypothetical protein